MIYNPYPQVDLPFGKDNKYFQILFDAIMRVDKSYVNYHIKELGHSQVTSTDVQEHVERVFAYELYRRWANLLEENGIGNLVLNGEISKGILGTDSNDKNKLYSVFPDLVLHTSQEKDNKQLMVCEIKRNLKFKKEDLLHDLCKLHEYIEDKDKKKKKKRGFVWAKNFRYGIFILVGSSVSWDNLKILTHETETHFLGNQIKWSDFKSTSKKCFSRIVCITYDGTILKYDTLKNIIKEWRND